MSMAPLIIGMVSQIMGNKLAGKSTSTYEKGDWDFHDENWRMGSDAQMMENEAQHGYGSQKNATHPVAGQIAGTVMGNLLRDPPTYHGDATRQKIRLGHQEDFQAHRRQDQYDWRVAQKRGITNTEFYGSGVAGAGGSPTGGAQVMGNNYTQNQLQDKQLSPAQGEYA